MILLVLGKQALYPGYTCLGQAGLPDVWGRQIQLGDSPSLKGVFLWPQRFRTPRHPEGIRHPFTLPPAKGTYLLKTCHSL